jgi:hypothetical protein
VHYAAHVPTFEDKLAQRAIVMVLEAVYEQDFLPCSFGFRPGRSARPRQSYTPDAPIMVVGQNRCVSHREAEVVCYEAYEPRLV